MQRGWTWEYSCRCRKIERSGILPIILAIPRSSMWTSTRAVGSKGDEPLDQWWAWSRGLHEGIQGAISAGCVFWVDKSRLNTVYHSICLLMWRMNFKARKVRSNDKHREQQWLAANLWTLFVEAIDFKKSCFWSSRLARVNCLIYHQNKWPPWWMPPGCSKLCREESFYPKRLNKSALLLTVSSISS